MADQEETFGLQNSPSGSESRDVQSENKPEKQNGTSSKSPSSQTTYIQQVSVARSVGRSVSLSVGLGASPFQAAFTDLWGHTHCKAKCISRLINFFFFNHNFWKAFYFFSVLKTWNVQSLQKMQTSWIISIMILLRNIFRVRDFLSFFVVCVVFGLFVI